MKPPQPWAMYVRWIIGGLLVIGGASCEEGSRPSENSGRTPPQKAQPPNTNAVARLIVTGTIPLPVKAGAGLGVANAIIATDRGYILVDGLIANTVYEYILADSSLTVIGARGTGTGEYVAPYWPAIARDERNGDILIYDGSTGKLLQYSREGRFVEQMNSDHRFSIVSKLLMDKDGDILEIANEDGIAVLRRFRRGDLKKMYSVRLTTQDTDALVWHIPRISGFCYSPSRHRVYYLPPAGYQVQVLDAASGNRLEWFGAAPEGFQPLKREYLAMGILKIPSELQPVLENTTLLEGGMYLLEDRWLVLGYKINRDGKRWLVYDVDTPVQPYKLVFPDDELIMNWPMCANAGTILRYSAPEEADQTKLGMLTQYRLEIEGHP